MFKNSFTSKQNEDNPRKYSVRVLNSGPYLLQEDVSSFHDSRVVTLQYLICITTSCTCLKIKAPVLFFQLTFSSQVLFSFPFSCRRSSGSQIYKMTDSAKSQRQQGVGVDYGGAGATLCHHRSSAPDRRG